MINDIIADALTRIRNASMRRLDKTVLMYSKSVEAILKNFEERGYIEGYKLQEDGNKKFLAVNLKYDEKGRPVINELKRISKPGRRVYKQSAELKKFKNGYGMLIVSTSKGVISNEEAHKLGVGGELLCSIW